MSRAQLTSTVEQNTGGAVAPFVAGKNLLVNGNFEIAQRGTSGFTSGYTLDRWTVLTGVTASISQQSTGTPNGSRYCLRSTMTSTGGVMNFGQLLETSTAANAWGKTIIFSVLLRRNSSFAGALNINIDKSATVDAGTGATWTNLTNVTTSNANLPTGTGASNWYLATATVAIPNDGTANSIKISISQTATETSGAYYEVAQAQLEVGPVATPFSRAGGTLSGELTACQRYYFRFGGNDVYQNFCTGIGNTAAIAKGFMLFPVPMRVAPTLMDFSTLATTDNDSYTNSFSGLTFDRASINSARLNITGGSGMTNKQMTFIVANNSTSAYLGFSAEL